MPRVLVTPTMLRNVPGRYRETLQSAGLEVVYPAAADDTMQPPVLARLLADVDAILASTEPLTRDVLAATRLRVVARMGVGYDSVDVPGATDLGIVVTITPGVLEESVAEHTIALLFGVARGVVERDRQVREGRWLRTALPRLAGKAFGIVGLGRIGRAVARKAQGLDMHVLAYDPLADAASAAAHGVRLCATLEELLAAADVVSLHAPGGAATRHLINARTLSLMKPRAIFLNTARGALVDETALVAALRSGHLLGAALDTFECEPLPLDHPLLALPNVLLCTHMGGLDEESQDAASHRAAQCIVDLHQQRWPTECVINRELAGQWQW